MYGLPADFATDFLRGKTLDMVCFVKHQLYLHFSGECLISVEGEISLDRGERLSLPASVCEIYALVDQEVVAVSSTTTGTLSLTFEKGQTLFLYDSSKQFESYSISEHGAFLVRV